MSKVIIFDKSGKHKEKGKKTCKMSAYNIFLNKLKKISKIE
jgi:hypothetical protein